MQKERWILMKLEHVAIWTHQLEELKNFYETFFGGAPNEKYVSDKEFKGIFESYFLTFGTGARLELMKLTNMPSRRQCKWIRVNRLNAHCIFCRYTVCSRPALCPAKRSWHAYCGRAAHDWRWLLWSMCARPGRQPCWDYRNAIGGRDYLYKEAAQLYGQKRNFTKMCSKRERLFLYSMHYNKNICFDKPITIV